jgi:AcrR family transcriptional regulator
MKATATRAPENTRGKILQAAFDEFYKNGFQGGSLNRIVDEAGTTKGALFHHFKGKKDLGYAVVREVIHPQFMQHWSDPLAYSTDPITDLKRIFRQCAKREIADGGLVHGCPVNNLAQEMSPLDEKFRNSLEKIYGGGVRPRDQGRQSEKRRFSAESGGVHRGGASGHGRYGQKRPGRGAALANEPSSFRLFGQLETLAILFFL